MEVPHPFPDVKALFRLSYIVLHMGNTLRIYVFGAVIYFIVLNWVNLDVIIKVFLIFILCLILKISGTGVKIMNVG